MPCHPPEELTNRNHLLLLQLELLLLRVEELIADVQKLIEDELL